MKKLTVLLLTNDQSRIKKITVPKSLLTCLKYFCFLIPFALGFFLYDYGTLTEKLALYNQIKKENQQLKTESKIIGKNLKELETLLKSIKNSSQKLNQIALLETNSFTKKTGLSSPEDNSSTARQPPYQREEKGLTIPAGIDP